MFEVNIYLETSLKGPARREGWYAAVVEYRLKNGDTVTREDFEYLKETTYHQSVLRGLLKSLKRLNAKCLLTIHTDSVYLVSSCENGNLEVWKTNGFQNIKGENIKNQMEWQEIARELDKHEVTFVQEKRNAYTEWMQQEVKRRNLKEQTT